MKLNLVYSEEFLSFNYFFFKSICSFRNFYVNIDTISQLTGTVGTFWLAIEILAALLGQTYYPALVCLTVTFTILQRLY